MLSFRQARVQGRKKRRKEEKKNRGLYSLHVEVAVAGPNIYMDVRIYGCMDPSMDPDMVDCSLSLVWQVQASRRFRALSFLLSFFLYIFSFSLGSHSDR